MLQERFEDACVKKLVNYLTRKTIIPLPIEIKIEDSIKNTASESQFNHNISFALLYNKIKKDSLLMSKILNNNKPLHAEYTEYISTELQKRFTFTKDFSIFNKRPGYFIIDSKKSVMSRF